jgi:hypothetical protein
MTRQQEIFTESQGKMRLAAIEEEKKIEEEERDRVRKNRDFTQIYSRGLIAQPELKPEAETESTDKKETSLQKEAKKHQERKTRKDLSKRKAQLLAELAEIEGEI